MHIGGPLRIGGLWRHPVKSLQGESVDSVLVTAAGVVGDRAWGVRDAASGLVLSAKREPRLLLATATVAGEGVVVRIPQQRDRRGSADDGALSSWLGREVRVEPATETPYVDEAHLHLLARGELGEWDVRRFRPNVLVDGVETLDDLVGERLALGPTVVVEVVKRTKRCAMPTMAQPGIDKDIDVSRTLARERELQLGVDARVVTPGRLDVGASITTV